MKTRNHKLLSLLFTLGALILPRTDIVADAAVTLKKQANDLEDELLKVSAAVRMEPGYCAVEAGVMATPSAAQKKLKAVDRCGSGGMQAFACSADGIARQLEAAKASDVATTKIAIGLMEDSRFKADLQAALEVYEESKDPRGLLSPDGGFLREQLKTEEAFQRARVLINEAKLKKADKIHDELMKSYKVDKPSKVLEDLKTGLVRYLKNQQKLANKALAGKEDRKQLGSGKNALNDKIYQQMIAAVEAVEIDPSPSYRNCSSPQQRVAGVRPGKAGEKYKIMVCPGFLASIGDNDEELASALSSALGGAIDSCAMDSMSVGEVSLGGVLEPLRECLGGKLRANRDVARRKVNPVMGRTPLFFETASKKPWNGFAVVSGRPHCVDLGKPGKKDQSTRAVAEFFGAQALKGWLEENDAEQSQVRNALALHCSSAYDAKGANPPASFVLGHLFGDDSDFREMIECKRFEQESSPEGRAELYALGKVQQAKAGAKSCDWALTAGFSDYAKAAVRHGYDLAEHALRATPVDKPAEAVAAPAVKAAAAPASTAAVAGISVGAAAQGATPAADAKSAAPAAEPEAAPAAAVVASAPASTPASAPADAAAKKSDPNQLTSKLFYGVLEDALAQDVNACTELDSKTFGLDIRAECKKARDAGFTRLDIDVRGGGRSLALGGSEALSANVGCQARCVCTEGKEECPYYPDSMFRGVTPPELMQLVSASSESLVERVANDIHFLDKFDGKHRFSFAAKACYAKAPEFTRPIAECAGKARGDIATPKPETVSFTGLTSGLRIDFGCEYQCPCDGVGRCKVVLHVPGAEDVAKKGVRGVPQTDEHMVGLPVHGYVVEVDARAAEQKAVAERKPEDAPLETPVDKVKWLPVPAVLSQFEVVSETAPVAAAPIAATPVAAVAPVAASAKAVAHSTVVDEADAREDGLAGSAPAALPEQKAAPEPRPAPAPAPRAQTAELSKARISTPVAKTTKIAGKIGSADVRIELQGSLRLVGNKAPEQAKSALSVPDLDKLSDELKKKLRNGLEIDFATLVKDAERAKAYEAVAQACGREEVTQHLNPKATLGKVTYSPYVLYFSDEQQNALKVLCGYTCEQHDKGRACKVTAIRVLPLTPVPAE